MNNIFNTDIKYLTGIGPKRAEILAKELNIKTFGDMFYFFPFRYIDRSRIYSIKEIIPSMAYIQIRGKIININHVGNNPRNRRLSITISDGTGAMDLIFFQGIKWIEEKLKLGEEYIVFGKPSEFNGIINMVHPEINSLSENIFPGDSKMMGIYPSTEKLKSNGIGNKVISKLEYTLYNKYNESIKETLPQEIINKKI
jgi:RecG-like helicase